MNSCKRLSWPADALRAFALGALAAATGLSAAQTPSPALVITINEQTGHALQIIDPRTEQVVGSVPIPGSLYAHEVAVSDDGRFAYVTNDAEVAPGTPPGRIPADFISIIDLAAQKEVRRVSIGPGSLPHGIVFVGGKLYYTAEGYRLIGRYDPASDRIDWMFGTGQEGAHMLAVSRDGNQIFAANGGADNVAALAPAEHQESDAAVPAWTATLIPVGKGPEGIALSPDGREVWALTRHDGHLSIIDVATKKVTQTVNLNTKAPLRLTFTPDGSRALIIDRYSGELLILDAATRREIKRFSNVGSGLHCVLVSPDGARAYVSGGHDEAYEGTNKMAVIDLNRLELTGHITIGEDADGMAWVERK